MALETGVRHDSERGTYVYYVVHDGAEIPFMERKTGNVDKRRAAAAERAQRESEQRRAADAARAQRESTLEQRESEQTEQG